jgi:hypothetical protein
LVKHTLSNYIFLITTLEAMNAITAGALRGLRKAEWGTIGAIGFIVISTPL